MIITIYLLNILCCFYIIYTRCENMDTAIIVALLGLIGTFFTTICVLIKGNRQDKVSFDFIKKELSGKHTLEKADKYYININNDISKTTKEIIETRQDINKNHYDIKKRIDKTWSNVNDSSAELKVLSSNFNNYLNSINNAKNDDINLINALKIIENYIYETGKNNLEIDKLKRINTDLKIQNDKLRNENIKLKTEISILKNKLIEIKNKKDLERNIDHDDISL